MRVLNFIQLYLDPGTGSMIIQLVIAGVTAVFFFFKSVRQKVVDLFKTIRKKPS